jgi:hypothetical protein
MSFLKNFAASLGILLVPIGIVMQLNGPSGERFENIEDLKSIIGVVRPNTLRDCSVTIDKTNQEAIVSESFILKVHVTMPENTPCESAVSINAPAFDPKPETETFSLPAQGGQTAQDFVFVILPKDTGSQYLYVNNGKQQTRIELSVKSYKYVPLFVTESSGVITSVMGGVLTVPWWIEWFSRRKRERKAEKERKEGEDKVLSSPVRRREPRREEN